MSAAMTYCTVIARNYLPRALALHASIRRHEPHRHLTVLVLDGPVEVPAGRSTGLSAVGPEILGLPERRFLELATAYDVIELATAVKPLLLARLLESHERVAYLDPDTFLVSPLAELEGEVDRAGGLLLTPHFLEPIPPDSSYISEIHSLTVGAYNLGFCAVGRGAEPFLDWWWSHLESECLIYPLLGLFVDQKWADIGTVLFPSAPLRHYGYNVGTWNLGERELAGTAEEPVMRATGEPLRLMHFSGFDPDQPTELSSRLGFSTADLRASSRVLEELCLVYAKEVVAARSDVGPPPPYAFAHDTRGRPLTKRVRRAFRTARLGGDETLPLPFVAAEADQFNRWRRRALGVVVRQLAADAAIATKYVLPDEYARFRRRMPRGFTRLRADLLRAGRVRR